MELVEVITQVGVAVFVHVLVGGEIAQDEREVVLIHQNGHQQYHRVVKEVYPDERRLGVDYQQVLNRRPNGLPYIDQAAKYECAELHVVCAADGVADVRAVMVKHRDAPLERRAMLRAEWLDDPARVAQRGHAGGVGK